MKNISTERTTNARYGSPMAPYFFKNKKGIVSIGTVNNEPLPSIETLKIMMSELSSLINQGQSYLDDYNKYLEGTYYPALNETPTEDNSSKTAGYVYILESNGKYKLGRTKNLSSRLQSYKTQNPFGIKVVYTRHVDDHIYGERVILSMFPHKNIVGEWFSLEKDDVDLVIKTIENL